MLTKLNLSCIGLAEGTQRVELEIESAIQSQAHRKICFLSRTAAGAMREEIFQVVMTQVFDFIFMRIWESANAY